MRVLCGVGMISVGVGMGSCWGRDCFWINFAFLGSEFGVFFMKDACKCEKEVLPLRHKPL